MASQIIESYNIKTYNNCKSTMKEGSTIITLQENKEIITEIRKHLE